MYGSRSSASRSRTRTSRGARTKHGARGVLRASSRRHRSATSSGPNLWPNTPDILPEQPAGGRPARVHAAARARRDARRELRRSTGRRSSCASTPRATRQRGVSPTTRSTSSGTGISSGPIACADVIARLNRDPPRPPARCERREPHFHRDDNDLARSATATARDDGRRDPRRRQPRSVHVHRAWLDARPGRAWRGRRSAIPGHDLLGGARYAWRGARNFVRVRSATSSPPISSSCDRTRGPSHDFEYFARLRASLRSFVTELTDDPLWFKDAIIYEVHVRAFHDTTNDGIGDIVGPDRPARLSRAISASPRSGCCRSIRRRCATAATTSPITRRSIPTTARSTTSRGFSAKRTRAASA